MDRWDITAFLSTYGTTLIIDRPSVEALFAPHTVLKAAAVKQAPRVESVQLFRSSTERHEINVFHNTTV